MRSIVRPLTALLPLLLVATGVAQAQGTDSVSAHRRIQPLPAVGSAPETGLQLGATVLAVFEPAAVSHTRASSIIASAIRSTKSQTRVFIEAEHWTTGNARRLYTNLAWQEYPLPYYGIGDTASERAKEIYTPRGIDLQFIAQQRIRGAAYGLLGARIMDQRMRFDTAGTLRRGTITGTAAGRIVEVTAGALLDTREHLFAPRGGTYAQFTYTRSADALGSQYSYGRVKLDARSYIALGGNHVLAAQVIGIGTSGSPPFDQLALVGGTDILRGYTRGRYRDRYLAAGQAEYRSPYAHRVGAVAFLGAGAVGRRFADLGSGAIAPTYGAGLRVQIDPRQRTTVRVDYGRGSGGASGLYIGFNQAF